MPSFSLQGQVVSASCGSIYVSAFIKIFLEYFRFCSCWFLKSDPLYF